MIRRPPRSTLSSSSAASDVYKRQILYILNNTLGTTGRLTVEYMAHMEGLGSTNRGVSVRLELIPGGQIQRHKLRDEVYPLLPFLLGPCRKHNKLILRGGDIIDGKKGLLYLDGGYLGAVLLCKVRPTYRRLLEPTSTGVLCNSKDCLLYTSPSPRDS
eukprot:TRINITY_DN37434_c0_g1_i1.p1 TRINITY_DN37434_c0_g1~~TRINITY_DN37434_c0_g1_i1.p1  ORF type:complete len:158 (+),score=14.47 TRINITY_DN37434_c0_g1_i1:89-562(+)